MLPFRYSEHQRFLSFFQQCFYPLEGRLNGKAFIQDEKITDAVVVCSVDIETLFKLEGNKKRVYESSENLKLLHFKFLLKEKINHRGLDIEAAKNIQLCFQRFYLLVL